MEQLWERAAQFATAGQPGVLATVMAVSGQIPAPSGGHMLVTVAEVIGSLDGGAADAVITTRLRATLGESARTERVTIPADIAQAHGLLHGGAVELLIQPLSAFDATMLSAVAAGIRAGESVAVVTPLVRQGEVDVPGRPSLVRNGVVTGDLDGRALLDAQQIAATVQPSRQNLGDGVAFVDVIRQPEELIILGATLIAEALSEIAVRAGFRVIVLDDNPALRERYPAAQVVISPDPIATLTGRPLNPAVYVVSMSVGHKYDLGAVQQLLRQPVRYVGMMGSRGRIERAIAALKDAGFTPEEIARLHAPVGLNLGAETPYEIAVAILAELIHVRRGQAQSPSDWTRPVAAAAGAAG